MRATFITPGKLFLALFVLVGAILACARLAGLQEVAWPDAASLLPLELAGEETPQPFSWFLPPTRAPGEPILTPTPDPPHALPTLRAEPTEYVVQPGEYLNQIAQRFGVSVDDIVQANDLASPDLLEVGQVLTIPAPQPIAVGPDFKILPDSELVYGPASADFDLRAFVEARSGYLAGYSETVNGRDLDGVQIVEWVAQHYSVNPRLLLAVLEYRSGWVTRADPSEDSLASPLGISPLGPSLYRQLTWTANNLNLGFYLWRVNGLAAWSLADGSLVAIAPTLNAGTAAVQHLFSLLLERAAWEEAVGEQGLFAVYNALFGYPFDRAVEPLLPGDLAQPEMQLPFEPGEVWRYTGGPHGGWDRGSAWAALDFAPPGEALGCVESEAWIVAVADGLIVRAEEGAVVQDLDGDGYEQTGWTVLYMHVESRQRVEPGTYLRAGERIGHPSCEGGVSTGTHVHLARRYNGEWIPADQSLPFVLDGWVSVGLGREYDGYLQRDGQTVEALGGNSSKNAIQR